MDGDHVKSTVVPREEILLVLPKLIKPKPFRRDILYALVVTDRRTLFARITDRMLIEAFRTEKPRRRWDPSILWWRRRIETVYNYERFLGMEPDMILAETPDNFAVLNSDIVSVSVRPSIPHVVDYRIVDAIRFDQGSDEDDVVHELPEGLGMRKEFQEESVIWELNVRTLTTSQSFILDYDPRERLRHVFAEKIVQHASDTPFSMRKKQCSLRTSRCLRGSYRQSNYSLMISSSSSAVAPSSKPLSTLSSFEIAFRIAISSSLSFTVILRS